MNWCSHLPRPRHHHSVAAVSPQHSQRCCSITEAPAASPQHCHSITMTLPLHQCSTHSTTVAQGPPHPSPTSARDPQVWSSKNKGKSSLACMEKNKTQLRKPTRTPS